MLEQDIWPVPSINARTLFGSTVESNLFIGAIFLVLSLLGVELMINLELIRKSQMKTGDLKFSVNRAGNYDNEFSASRLSWNRRIPTNYKISFNDSVV